MKKGFILPLIVSVLLVFLIMVPMIVKWLSDDTKQTIREERKSKALYLAEAAVERGYWKVKSSTTTFNNVMRGNIIEGYNFDRVYRDIEGGSYRVKVSSGPDLRQVTIIGEGRDYSTNETRAIRVVFENKTIYSPLLSNGNLTASQFLCAFWGPIMAQGNYSMTDANAAKRYFPRKYARGNLTGTGVWQRDTNGPNPPNTDNVEWWSYYEYIPEVPMLDFVSLRSSAAATGTLNVYDSKSDYTGSPCKTTSDPITGTKSICKKFPIQPSTYTAQDLVWYWDRDVIFQGYEGCSGNCPYNTACTNHGFKGIVVVRGNLTIRDAGCYKFRGPVPKYAYKEHYKLLDNYYDTTAANEYPADIGYQINKTTFNFGTETFQPYPGAGTGWINTVGVRGFTYVGGNLTIVGPWGFTDFVGAVWIVGNVTATGGSGTAFCGVFFDDTLSVPTLNVILVRQSWEEITPSNIPWS